MSEPKMTAESLLGPVAEGDVVIDAGHFIGVLAPSVGSLLKYERCVVLRGQAQYVADASACRVFVDRRRALRAIECVQTQTAELERQLKDAGTALTAAHAILIRLIDANGEQDYGIVAAARELLGMPESRLNPDPDSEHYHE